MAFEKVNNQSDAKGDETGIRISLARIKSAPAKLRLIVDDSLLAEVFGSLGVKQSFDLLVGTEADHGFVRLVQSSAGTMKAVVRHFGPSGNQRKVLVFNCGHLRQFVDRSEAAQPVQWKRIDAATIEIVLPNWADETRPAQTRTKPAMSSQKQMNDEAVARRKRLGL
ncbi:hypothetical protein FJU08_01275 [Martelella alba]|uniref:Uncharacterized protein n=1 Tax=Martelella alba TaxID=2590451 RepID=A0A506UIS2_9HYPH|nr:hypothetical protein [Martelella alba]TPW33225.1 hypothetical protein FJU08_01275 [Martelella alba]